MEARPRDSALPRFPRPAPAFVLSPGRVDACLVRAGPMDQQPISATPPACPPASFRVVARRARPVFAERMHSTVRTRASSVRPTTPIRSASTDVRERDRSCGTASMRNNDPDSVHVPSLLRVSVLLWQILLLRPRLRPPRRCVEIALIALIRARGAAAAGHAQRASGLTWLLRAEVHLGRRAREPRGGEAYESDRDNVLQSILPNQRGPAYGDAMAAKLRPAWRRPRKVHVQQELQPRSEERRVGKECRLLCRSRWSPYH